MQSNVFIGTAGLYNLNKGHSVYVFSLKSVAISFNVELFSSLLVNLDCQCIYI